MSDRFFAFVRARVESDEAAHDVLQAAHVKRLENPGSSDAWFFRVLRNAIIDRHRHAVIAERALQPEEEPAAETPRRICGCVDGVLKTLKPEYEELIRRVDLEEGSVSEAAEALGITRNAAAVRLHRARAALRDGLRRTCRVCATQGCLDCRCKPHAPRSSA